MSTASNAGNGKITVPGIVARKKLSAAGFPETNPKITCLTAYDFPTALLLDDAGIDILLVGDSLGMVVLGEQNTLGVTLDDLLHHLKAVRRATRRALVV